MALLLPLSVCNLRAAYTDTLIASDASPDAAGGVACKIGQSLVAEVWRRIPLKLKGQRLLDHRAADLRGSGLDIGGDSDSSEEGECERPTLYAEPPTLTPLQRAEDFWASTRVSGQAEEEERFKCSVMVAHLKIDPERCLFELKYVVLEVCGGKGGISGACRKASIYCGPVIELADGFDLLSGSLFFLLLRLCLAGRVWLAVLEPPCTTFSLARKPGLRDSNTPEGYDVCEAKTHAGNLMGLLCCILCLCQWSTDNEFLFEQPAYGHMRFSFFWLAVMFVCGDSLITPWCQFITTGPVYKKPTVLMFRRGREWWHRLFRVCKCSSHVPLEGSLTTLAAAYPAGFCRAVGKLVQEFGPTTEGPWLGDLADTGNVVVTKSDAKEVLKGRDQIGTRGKPRRAAVSSLYAVILSECLPWRANLKMVLNKKGHINIQEQHAFRAACRRAPRASRIVIGQDSRVNLGVESKGRSASTSLNRTVLQTWAEVLGRDQYVKGLHMPTWSLRADDPSRGKPVSMPRMAWPPWLFDILSQSEARRRSAVAALDEMEDLSRQEVRWMGLVLAAAAGAQLILGRSLCRRETASSWSPRRRGDSPASDPGADGSPARGTGGRVLPGGRGSDRGDVRGSDRVRSAAGERPAQEVWLESLRVGLGDSRFSESLIGSGRPLSLGSAEFWERLEGGAALANARAGHTAYAPTPAALSGDSSDRRGLALVESPAEYVSGLLRLASTGRALWSHQSSDPPAKGKRRRAGSADSSVVAETASGRSASGIHQGRSGVRPRAGDEASVATRAYGAHLARFARATRATLAENLGTVCAEPKDLLARLV